MNFCGILTVGLFSSVLWQQDPYVQLQRLNGTWKMQTPKGTIYESWKKITANEMQGGSYRINGRDTIRFEFVRLTKQGGEILYIPIANNQNEGKAVSFKMISSANNNFIFENKEHDFPQRIIYHIVNKDSVHAWIEGTHNGKAGREDYYFQRIAFSQ